MSKSWNPFRNGAFFLSAFLLTATAFSGAAQETTCSVDWNDVHQRIDGFGASSAWRSQWTSAQADMFFSTNSGTAVTLDGKTNFAFNGVDLSLLRSRIAPGGVTIENSIMQMAQARGAKVWSTPWSPAAQFKDNANVNGGGFVSTPANYQAYANQQAGYVANMQTQYGINLYAISVQNEPDANVTTYESCNLSPQQIHDFVPYLYHALSNLNLAATKIILPESQNWPDYSNLTVTAMSDPAVAADVGIVADHNYDGRNGPANLTKNNYGKALWETEVATFDAFDGSIANGVYVAQRMHLFLTQAQVNAWHYWWLINANSDNEGLTDANGFPAKRMYAVGQFSRFIRPNFYRIGANANASAALISAYKDSGSSSFAIVAINTNASTAITQTFNLTNFTAGSVTPWITSATSSLGVQPAVSVANGTFTYTLPAQSVVTFVGQGITVSLNNVVVTPRPGSAIFSWSTGGGAISSLKYGTTPACNQTYALASPAAASQLVFTPGLATNTTYYYQIAASSVAGGALTNSGTFSTDVEVILESSQASYAGVWVSDASGADRLSPVYKIASVAPAAAQASATFRPNIPVAGLYDVYLWYAEGANRSAIAPVQVVSQSGIFSTTADETKPGGKWVLVAGAQPLSAGTSAFVQLGNSTGETNKIVIADAVRWVYTPGQDLPANGNAPGWWTSFYFGSSTVRGSLPGANGYSLLQNYVLGLSPVDPGAGLSVGLQRVGASGLVVFAPWESGRQYQLQSAASLGSPIWSNVASATLQSTNGVGTFTDPNAGPGPKFYRLSVVMTQ